MPETLTIITYFIDAFGVRSTGNTRTRTSATENIHLNENGLPMGPIGTLQSSTTSAPCYLSHQAANSESRSASDQHNRREGGRTHSDSASTSEQSFDSDIEAQIDNRPADDSGVLSMLFQRWGKHHYAGVAAVLVLLHVARSVY